MTIIKRITPLAIIGFLIMSLSFGAGFLLGHEGFKFQIQQNGANKTVDFSLLTEVVNLLEDKYLRASELNTQNLIYGAASGMVKSLGDPYTAFFDPQQNQDFNESLEGIYEGIGAQLGFKDSQVVIVAPLDESPALKAGLKANDAILAVDGESTVGWSIAQAVAKIRGPADSNVKLLLLRDRDKENGAPFEVELTRKKIKVASVRLEWKGDDQEIAYLRILRFGTDTNKDWDEKVSEIVRGCSRRTRPCGLILDVRNNPGGYLEAAVHLGSEFFEDGIIVKRRQADRSELALKVDHQGRLTQVPVVVLINQGSASASEILAGAIKVRGRGELVGETSFGKGTIQEAVNLVQGASLHITAAEWLLPDGTAIDGVGLEPNFKIEITDEEAQAGKDAQLEKAIEILKSKYD